MARIEHPDLERQIAATRIFLSVAAVCSVYLDPTRPALTRWFPLTGGAFAIDAVALTVMALHLSYALLMYRAVHRAAEPLRSFGRLATTLDVLFGGAIVLVTEGATSPAYAFFAFAVLASGCRWGLRATLFVTGLCVALYIILILSSTHADTDSFVMRPAYLALTGVLIGYLGQRRLNAEAKSQLLEAAAQREQIAQSLHDGHVQTLAAVTLTLESCCELLRREKPDVVLNELIQLRTAVIREHRALRSYIRSLVNVRAGRVGVDESAPLEVSVNVVLSGSDTFVEDALCITLEGLRNARRHARAKRLTITAQPVGSSVTLTIADDGRGFPPDTPLPWSIVSRVEASGGRVQLASDTSSGAKLLVEIPAT